MSVPRYTVSQILQEHGIGDFTLVCDIEGEEKSLLAFDSEALTRCGMVIVELHASTAEGIEDLVRGILTADFR